MRNLISLPINTIFEKWNYDLKIIKPFPHWIVLVTMKGYSGSYGTWNTMLLEKPECHESHGSDWGQQRNALHSTK